MPTLAERLEAVRRSHFVGREAELDLFQSALESAELPFVVLHIFGPGGVGKTTLLHQYITLANRAQIPVIYLDGRHLDPNPDLFLLALQQALKLSPPADVYEHLAARNGRSIILIDTYETLKPIDGWLRDVFLPRLSGTILFVLAGRHPPSLRWRTDPGWQQLLHILPLRNFNDGESRDYLLKRRVPADQHDTFLNFTHGHPLALSLGADLYAQRSGVEFHPKDAPDIIKALLEQLSQEVPGPHHREALEASALVRLTNEALLAELLAVPEAHDLFQWLRGLSFMDIHPRGLFPHDLAREALTADLRWRNPDQYAELHRRARSHYLKRLEQSQSREQRRVLLDYIYLHRDNPMVRPYFEWQVSGTVYTDAYKPEDETAVLAMIDQHEGNAAADHAAHWLKSQPWETSIFRDATDQPKGALITVALEQATPIERTDDPATDAAWRYLLNTAPLRPGERATYFRFWMATDTYQAVSPVQSRIFLNMVQHYLTTPNLAYTFLPCANPDHWTDVFAYADLTRLPEVDFVTNGRRFGVYGHDWRAAPPMAWLGLMAEREIATTPTAVPAEAAESYIVLSQSDFAAAVRSALRNFRDPSALRANPLLHSQLVTGPGGHKGDKVIRLQSLLQETAASLQNTPRQLKFYMALHHTYFQPAATQEKAAELLNLPFSTYRRHLRTGIEYLTERLWQLELSSPTGE